MCGSFPINKKEGDAHAPPSSYIINQRLILIINGKDYIIYAGCAGIPHKKCLDVEKNHRINNEKYNGKPEKQREETKYTGQNIVPF